MKKIFGLAVVVAMAFAFSAWAGDTVKEKVTVKENKGVETVKAVEKDSKAGTKEVVKATEKGTTVTGTDTTTMKKGDVAKETVAFEKYEQNGDYVYLVKDNKVIRVKHTLSDSMKKDMLTLKKGDQIQVTSTRPLSVQEVAVITGIEKASKTVEPTPAKK